MIPNPKLLNELEAKEAVMNGARVRLRRSPPYLTCLLCCGDGSGYAPFLMDCSGPHDAGWEVVEEESNASTPLEVPEAIAKALRYEAEVIEAQSQNVKALSKGRRHYLALCAERLRMLADGNTYPYVAVSYGEGIRAFVDEL